MNSQVQFTYPVPTRSKLLMVNFCSFFWVTWWVCKLGPPTITGFMMAQDQNLKIWVQEDTLHALTEGWVQLSFPLSNSYIIMV